MIELTTDYKSRVIDALLSARDNYSGNDTDFARKWGIDKTVYSRLKKGYQEGLLSVGKYIEIGMELNVSTRERKWNMVRTEVFNLIEAEVKFCKAYSKGKIFVDKCAIGKTYSAKYLSQTLPNCFYVDMSQAKKPSHFARALARAIGAECKGRLVTVKERIKYYLKLLPSPVVIIDEAGDMDITMVSELKEYYNALDGMCGWYVLGANGLRAKINYGIEHEAAGYEELFSRLSDKYSTIVPANKNERLDFYRRLCRGVLEANMTDHTRLDELVAMCLKTEKDGEISGLRRAESLLILSEM